jgi:hypothetical protein
MTDAAQAATTPPLKYERTEQFVSSYANSLILESTAWDIKLIFGLVEQVAGTMPAEAVVKQHLAVTIPWSHAKLALFWLRLQVEAAEASVKAKIPIRSDLLPPEVSQLPRLTPEQENDPSVKEFRELYRRIREEFLASL